MALTEAQKRQLIDAFCEAARKFADASREDYEELIGTESVSAPAEFMLFHEAAERYLGKYANGRYGG